MGSRKNSRVSTRLCLLALCCLSWATPLQAQGTNPQLKVQETIWGFDGRVLPGFFNPVSFMIDNPTGDQISGVIRLENYNGLTSRQGGIEEQAFFLGPNSRRWVQFYPYISRDYGNWRMTVITDSGTRQNFRELEQGRSILPGRSSNAGSAPSEISLAAVILDRPGVPSRQPVTVKHFPNEIFPPYAPATSGLHAVFLDHVPNWELPRQQAFLTWLKGGGQLYLLNDSRGNRPRFSDELTELNQPDSLFTVGSGTVRVLPTGRDAVDDGIISAASRPANTERVTDIAAEANLEETGFKLQYGDRVISPAEGDEDIARQLREMTQPQHAWWLILLLSLVYVGMIFPGTWLVSKHPRVHYLGGYAVIAGLAIAFSLFFFLIGRRGYGEATVLNSIGLVRQVDSDTWNARQWCALFVVDGSTYEISVPEQQALYSLGDSVQAIDATIRDGNQGNLSVKIPPFSSQPLHVSRVIRLPELRLVPEDIDAANNTLRRLTVRIEGELPVQGEPILRAAYAGNLYQLRYDESQKTMQLIGSLGSIAVYSRSSVFDHQGGFGSPNSLRDRRPQDPEKRARIFFEQKMPELVNRMMLDDGYVDRERFVVPPGSLRILIGGMNPTGMNLALNSEAEQPGYSLFSVDVNLNDADSASDN